MNKKELLEILDTKEKGRAEEVRRAAERTLLKHCGKTVYFRGLIEFSNQCRSDCFYCGIRKGNAAVRRYALKSDEIVAAALWCAKAGYGSVVLQSGERQDRDFVEFVEQVVRRIKKESVSAALPEGLGITLSAGEQEADTFRQWFDAGAHRYLLRIETSNPDLFARLHPGRQRFADRVIALENLKKAGFQVGSGIMIGLPGQQNGHLADDLLFLREMDVDMVGMGPYIVHRGTPMAGWPDVNDRAPAQRLDLALHMIAAARLLLKDVNIAAATALQAIDPAGREEGLRWGANVIMPQVTPAAVRRDYQLYEGKPCLDESADQCRSCLEKRIASAGREIGYNAWGDSKHATRRRTSPRLTP